MILDIDSFKYVNDKYGHKVGDEFVGIFPGLREEDIIGFGEKLLHEISKPEILAEDKSISTTASVGFSYFKTSDNSCSDVLQRADEAMYKSKGKGKNKVSILL